MEKNLERDLLNYLYFDLNRLRYFIFDEVFEYDIQASIHQFLKFKLKNKDIKVQRERLGKVDITITEINPNGEIINCSLIEVKSFIKKKEKINFNNILNDIKKLKNKIKTNIDGYLLLAIKESHFQNKNKDNKDLSNLLKTLSGKKKTFTFNTDNCEVKTRIIRSLNTTYYSKRKCKLHKFQIRIYLFQIKKYSTK